MNTLYPIFIKLHQLKVLVVGAGEVGYEKIFFILKNSPNADINIVADELRSPELKDYLENSAYKLSFEEKAFDPSDVMGYDLVIAATNISDVNKQVHKAAKEHKILVNVADTPDLCDFYLGSIISRGDLKVAISTNGKSPTFAKRFRQLLEKILPSETADLLNNLAFYRKKLEGDFEYKVKALNDLTKSLVEDEESIHS